MCNIIHLDSIRRQHGGADAPPSCRKIAPLILGAALFASCVNAPSQQAESSPRARDAAEAPSTVDATARAQGAALQCDDAGCSEHHDEVNRGLLCVARDKSRRAGELAIQNHLNRNKAQIEPGKRAYVVIDSEPCVTTSRLRNASFRCAVTAADAGTLAVETHYVYDELERGITEDCQRLNTACELPPLPAGKYRLSFGGDTLALEVPGSLQGACLHRR